MFREWISRATEAQLAEAHAEGYAAGRAKAATEMELRRYAMEISGGIYARTQQSGTLVSNADIILKWLKGE